MLKIIFYFIVFILEWTYKKYFSSFQEFVSIDYKWVIAGKGSAEGWLEAGPPTGRLTHG